MNKLTQNTKGFTIIEVVLVLAIAALIFLMVFIALPALQANQRDTERKQDASLVSSAVTKYTTGERKTLTGSTPIGDLRQYVEDISGQYPAGPNAVFIRTNTSQLPGKEQIFVYPRAKCDGSSASSAGAGAREAAVVIRLDNGNNTHCVDAS